MSDPASHSLVDPPPETLDGLREWCRHWIDSLVDTRAGWESIVRLPVLKAAWRCVARLGNGALAARLAAGLPDEDLGGPIRWFEGGRSRNVIDLLAEVVNWCETATATPAEDSSVYRPLTEFLDAGRFSTTKRVHAALNRNPWIRTNKPSAQRFCIHAGDWQVFLRGLDSAGFDALDVSTDTVTDFLDAARQRQEEIKRRKARK